MKVLKIVSIATVATLLLTSVVSEARPSVNHAMTEQDIFANTLYPFMRKNCIECHGEQAVYPAGPKHTHSNLKMAYMAFSKFVDRNDFANSRFIKYASNKHFCKEFNVNCDRMDQIVEDLNKLFVNYMTKAKALQKNEIDKGLVISGDSQTILQTQTLGANIYTLTIKLKKFTEEYRKIESVTLKASNSGVISYDGIEIKINGQLPKKRSSLESTGRKLKFQDRVSVTTLSTSQEVILDAKDGDQISVQLKNLRNDNIVPNPICQDSEKWSSLSLALEFENDVLNNFNINTFGPNTRVTEMALCEQLMLQIDLTNPSQSFLLKQAPKPLRMKVLNFIRSALTKGTEVEKPFVRQNIESIQSNHRTTCFKLTDQSMTCFGEALSKKGEIQTYSTESKYSLSSVGTDTFAFVNGAGDIEFPFRGESETFPINSLANGRYTPPGKIIDLQVGYEMTCFLTVDKDVYCGGKAMSEVGLSAGKKDFIKISTMPIQRISLNLARLILISENNEAYIFGPNSLFKSKSDMILGSDEKIPRRLNLPEKVNRAFQGFYQTCFEDLEGFITCYGDKESDGEIISRDLKFKDFAIHSGIRNSMCGLTESNELYCQGTYPKGLRSVNGRIRSLQFEKIANAPANIKLMAGAHESLFLVTSDNYIQGVSVFRNNIVGLPKKNGNMDKSGRQIFAGPDYQTPKETLSPYIAQPID